MAAPGPHEGYETDELVQWSDEDAPMERRGSESPTAGLVARGGPSARRADMSEDVSLSAHAAHVRFASPQVRTERQGTPAPQRFLGTSSQGGMRPQGSSRLTALIPNPDEQRAIRDELLAELRTEMRDELRAAIAEGVRAEMRTHQPQPAAQTPENTAPRIRLSDVKLQQFSGSKSPDATNIDSDQYYALLEWLERSELKIRNSKLDQSLHAQCLLEHLTGAAEYKFFAVNRGVDMRNWSLAEAVAAVASLVPDYKAKFTRRAVDMKFRKNYRDLSTDIDRFYTYLVRGAISPDISPEGSKFFFDFFKDKLVAAVPTIFSDGSAKHDIHVRFKTEQGQPRPFADIVADAQRLVQALSADADAHRPSQTAPQPAQPISAQPDRQTAAQRPGKRERHRSMTPAPAQRSTTPAPAQTGPTDAE